jgi:hypothetical protein
MSEATAADVARQALQLVALVRGRRHPGVQGEWTTLVVLGWYSMRFA